jgi:DNA-binding transcriptional MocR family regulator
MIEPAQAVAWEPRYASRARRMAASEIRELLKVVDQPGVLSFAGGIPDPALFPVEEAKVAYAAALGASSSGLQYSVSEGFPPLRQWIAAHMGSLGVPCDVENIVITCGSQQALEFLGRLLLSPGDTALVMAPTYLGALQAFSGSEPRYDELRPEDGNRTPASYADAACSADGEVKFAYVVPSFANPTGATLSLTARERLLDLAGELDIPVVEDSAYAMLSFEAAPLPSLMALEIARRGSIERARVVYCGTFSKVLAPGLRVGWIAGPKALIRRLVLVKQASDLNSATINQMVMHRLAEAAFDAQVERPRPLPATARLAALRPGAAYALRRQLDPPRRRPVRVGDAARERRRRRPAAALTQGGRRSIRAGRCVLLRRPRAQHAALELFAARRGGDRPRDRRAGTPDLMHPNRTAALSSWPWVPDIALRAIPG